MQNSFPVIDTHTGGEITRVVLGDEIGLPSGSPQTHLHRLRGELDWVRRSLTSEPRGSEFAVGAVVTPTQQTDNRWSIVFFNNVGYLGMCGHGLIGVVEALRHLNQIPIGPCEFATPVGDVTATLTAEHTVRFTGVKSVCYRRDVNVECDDGTMFVGDIAYGGNWFFLAHDATLLQTSTAQLMDRCRQIRAAIDRDQIRGADGAVIDHIELCGPLPVRQEGCNAGGPVIAGRWRGCRSFVLCPGGHYDRSPCGTGTSAKLACLAARGRLGPGEVWIQESVTNSRFIASYQYHADGVRVTVTGRAHVIAETRQIFDSSDPLRFGITELPVKSTTAEACE